MPKALPHLLQQVLGQINSVVLGKQPQVKLAVACLLAQGHLLIEDLPGMGKTTMAEALARSFGLAFKRVHFTSDLLPADLSGVSVFEQQRQTFTFHPGPLFSQVLLADEINRASPRTQSALLEAMASGQVSLDGTSHNLPQPFFVIATQNGLDHAGTYPLPESQLDRFLMRLSLGFPERGAERALLLGQSIPLQQLQACLQAADLKAAQQHCRNIAVQPALVDYVLDLLTISRRDHQAASLSPRAAQGLIAAARAWAVLEQRNFVTPADVIAVFPAIAEHRLDGGHSHGNSPLSQKLLEQVDGIR
ncbi:MAG: AAA family ATPase [Prochlorococcus sp.]